MSNQLSFGDVESSSNPLTRISDSFSRKGQDPLFSLTATSRQSLGLTGLLVCFELGLVPQESGGSSVILIERVKIF